MPGRLPGERRRLAAAFWLAGRWMVVPLIRLSAQVDKVAGGDLAVAVPRSRIGETGAPIHLSWAARDESSVEITVPDHGSGIDPGLLPHIFEPGIRETSAPGDADAGAGLGVAIAKRLLEHRHATVTARNRPDGGAELRLTVQRAPSADPS